MALIAQQFLDCVAAIGKEGEGGERRWVASAFFYGRVRSAGAGENTFNVFLVTNRHVLEGSDKVWIRLNPIESEPAREVELALKDPEGSSIWYSHPDPTVDVAVVPTGYGELREQGFNALFFRGDTHAAPVDKMNELGMTEGDFIYVVGFPMGLVGDRRNAVIVRSGCIARIRDALSRHDNYFLVDASIFPGNSGGPVVLKPDSSSLIGTKSQNLSLLIGIVSGYLPYQDVAMSLQSNRPRVIFEENSGLVTVHPVDYIEETIEVALAAIDQAPPQDAEVTESQHGFTGGVEGRNGRIV